MLSDKQIADYLKPQLAEHGVTSSDEYIEKVCAMMKNRISFPSELWETTSYFFEAPKEYNPADLKKRWKAGMTTHMNKILEILDTVPFEHDALHKVILDDYIVANQFNMGQIMNSFRIALIGKTVGPDLLTFVMVIGKDETVSRLKKAVETIGEIEG